MAEPATEPKAHFEPKHIVWVEDAVRENPNDLNARLALLKVLGEAGLDDKLELARRSVIEVFPLPESHWRDWLALRLGVLRALLTEGTDSEAVHLLAPDLVALFQRAVADCPWSVELWKSFTLALQMVSTALSDDDAYSLAKVRETFELSVAVLGHSPLSGAAIWRNYIDWEEEMCATLEQIGQPTEKQIEQIRALYSRAMAAPLRDHTDLWEEYAEWEEDEKKPKGVEKRKSAGQSAYALRKTHEEAIAQLHADPEAAAQNVELYQAVQDYLAFEETQLTAKKEKGKRNVLSSVSLFERALSVYGSIAELWLRYHSFISTWCVEEHLLGWAERALRNCRWSGAVQATAARVLHKLKKRDPDAVKALLEASLLGGLAGADDYHLVHNALEDLFPDEEAVLTQRHEEVLRTHFSNRPDLLASVYECKAGKAALQGDMDAFHTNWEAAIKVWGSTAWDTWSRFINASAARDAPAKTRSLWKRAVYLVQDAPEAAMAAWMLWERQCGDADAMLDAQVAIERRARAVALLRLQWQRKQQEQESKTASKAAPKRAKEAKAKKAKTAEADDNAETSGGAPEASKSARTIFVKNLAFEMEEDGLREIFGSVGAIESLRLMRDALGKSRGFAFIEFAKKDDAASALVFNGRSVMDRELIVMQSASSVGESGAIPVSTLYVSNLPYEVTDSDIRAGLEGAAAALLATNPIRSIRVLAGKGQAFVEFQRPLAPDTIKLDGLIQVKGRVMKVEFAKPKAKHSKKDGREEESSAGAAATAHEPHQKRARLDLGTDASVAAASAPSSSATSGDAAPAAVDYDDSRTVYVGSIAAGATEAKIREQMESLCGPVITIRLVKGHDGAEHKGKAYVDFATSEAREKALALSGKLAILDKPVLISVPKPRQKGKSLKGTGFVTAAPSKPVASLVPTNIARMQQLKKRRTADAASSGNDNKPKTQEDFKKMFQ
jgi:RNA recognition motif-containing protein